MEQTSHPGPPLKPVASIDRQEFCGAKTRQGGTCRKPPLKGRRRCRMHGGKTPCGSASPHFKTGRYSRYLPTDLRQRYAEHCRDRHGNNLQDEIGLLTSHIGELLRQAYQKGSANSFPRLKKLMVEINVAMKRDKLDKMHVLLIKMSEAIDGGMECSALWDKITERIESRRRLVDTQRKYDIDMGRMLPVEQAHQFMATLGIIVKEACEHHINDRVLSRTILIEINNKFQAVFGDPLQTRPNTNLVH